MPAPRIGLLVLLAVTLFTASVGARDPTAREILDRVDDVYRGTSSKGEMTMTVINPNYTRQLTLRFWSQGKDKSLFRIWLPKKERRTATLRNGNNIWNYLPKVDRTIKIPSSMMGGSWMGSDFTNDDLVKESRMADDYTSEITFRGERGGQNVIILTCHPKPDAAVVWGKVVVTVRQPDYLPLRILYYKENGDLARQLSFTDVRTMGSRTLPTRMTMIPLDKPGHSTVVTYQSIEFDVSLPGNAFTVANLRH
jgi:outer membrane lipoprotein-sorting protein